MPPKILNSNVPKNVFNGRLVEIKPCKNPGELFESNNALFIAGPRQTF
jgi:hypothetical protein